MNPAEQRRATPRSRTLLEGQIVYNNRLSRMECIVRDLSETGACLVFSQPVKVPREFELQIPKKKLIRHAQIMWYDGQHHGVMFLDEASVAESGAKLPASGSEAASVPEILDETRLRIAQLLGVSVDVIQLKLGIGK
ncbi:PilZ domain-containing protein [Microvirga guangxiensis]|uniref:PilZ domain-containing protein n=1 Tax=Microvirga guangxiensis TaxID=549386 RepID=A0A1G5GQA7_9HYPH|nr:PilZ domain-containing protein [Microvirga guangxiensis]SCY53762.1 PilZ domain-containing protein [Microvirga guangxiensis]